MLQNSKPQNGSPQTNGQSKCGSVNHLINCRCWRHLLPQEDQRFVTKCYKTKAKKWFTGNTLDEISHHAAEMGSDVFKHVQLLLILSLQKHAGQIHILKEQSTQSQGITLQCSIGATEKETESMISWSSSFMLDRKPEVTKGTRIMHKKRPRQKHLEGTQWIKCECYLSLITAALASSSKILSSCSLRRSLLSLRFLF